jgi:GNAT-like C-terminal domain/N-acyltransferase N-terminal domain
VLPDDAEVTGWLPGLGVDPAEATDLLAGRPGPDRERRVAAVQRQLAYGMGRVGYEPAWPELPDPDADTYLHAWALLATLPAVREYHRERGIGDDVSWATLADFGRQLGRCRRMFGHGGLASAGWLTLHFRGIIYQLGRLQFQRATEGGPVLHVHIPATGPLTPRACDASFAWARVFFAAHYPTEEYRQAACHSWLLDGQLAEYLPADSNILRFQRRFRVPEAAAAVLADLDVLKFVFDRPTLPLRPGELDTLPQDSTLRRAIVAHLKAGRHWWSRTGRCPL